jgi:tRNA dimethylallyltransferase
LIDSVAPTIQFTAADFIREAVKAAGDILSRGKLPFVVGGTGLYIKALVDGLFPGSGRDPEIRSALEAEAKEQGLHSLFEKLKAVDPEYAAKIRGRDRIRIIRALEVHRSTGKPLSEHFLNTESPLLGYRVQKIGLRLERSDLYLRIEGRVDRMFERGLVDEVRDLLAQGIPPEAPAFRALGYRHVLRLLAGEISLDQAKDLTKLDTRHYAKRQMTWFRKMKDVAWFSPEDRKALEDHLLNQIK